MAEHDGFKFLDKTQSFFDDDIDNTQIRFEEGEDMEHYGFREATEHEVDAAMNGGDCCDDDGCGTSAGQKPEQDEYDFRMEGRGGASSAAHQRRPMMGGKSTNTGPKGVKKDYEDAKKATKINREMDNVRRERLIRQHVSGKKRWYLDGMNQIHKTTHQVDADGKLLHNSDASEGRGKKKFSSTKSADDSHDEEYLRLKHSRETQLAWYQDQILEQQSDLCGNYIRAANIDTVAAMLKASHPDCYSILHVYDNENPCCQRLHLIFEELAEMFDHVMFFRARQEDIMPNFDKRFLPTIIIYKGVKKVEELLGVTALWGVVPDDDLVVKTLADKRYLQMPTQGLDQPGESERRRHFVAALETQDDDDSWLDAE